MTTTLSQLVDDIVRETNRFDLVADITRYANQTIREVHADPEKNTPLLFDANRNEQTLVATGESLAWDIPSPEVFQQLEAARYNAIINGDGKPVFATRMNPSTRQAQIGTFYYRVRNTYSFAGFGGVDASVSLSWFEFPGELAYFAAASRPASFTTTGGWAYGTGITTPELQAAAQLICTNWLLSRWEHVIAEGLRAKVYKRMSDDSRSRTCYSMFQAQRKLLVVSEAFESGSL